MNKTPEEMAEEYRKAWGDEQLYKIRHEHKRFEWSDALIDGFLAGYKAAQDQLADADKVMPQWISVKERLPEEGQDCLFYVDWIDVWEKGSERITYQEIGVFNGKDRFDHRAHTDLKEVTHWMPLPAPPKEEK